MTFCSQYTEAIHELVDGTLGPVRRAELQTHLDRCENCAALVADLEKIRDAAASLDPIGPPDHVWLRIAGQLRHEGRLADAPQVRSQSMAMLAMAASLVLVIGSALYMLGRYEFANDSTVSQSQGAVAGGNAEPDGSVQGVRDQITQELDAAGEKYESAIVMLEEAVKSDDGTIDPQTAGVLKKNLQVIDEAIAESRSALQSEPQSAPARESLFEALRKKVDLLQDTLALMNEMRKGNSAGAAQLVDPGSKS